MIDNAKLTEIKKREERLVTEKWYYDGETICESQNGNPVITANNHGDIMMGEVVGQFIVNAREDIPMLVVEIERLQAYTKTLKETYWNGTDYELEQLIIHGGKANE